MRLLIIEDEPNLLKTLASEFRDEGYAVDTADQGNDGLTKALDTDYDAILLDVMLPGLDGWEVLEGLRREKKTPVLMLTARDAVPERIKGLDLGADDYLTKPCDLNELFARVRALIRRSENQPNPVLKVGNGIEVDTSAHKVMLKGEEVALTAREYNMVEFFALRRGRVVTRTMLYEHLFDEDESSMSNLLDVHVYNIRKKFGADFIKTRRGLGYILE